MGASPVSLARELAERICALRYQDLPPAAVYASRVAVLDTVGVMLAGSREDAPRIVAEVLALDQATGPCLVFGTARRAGADPFVGAMSSTYVRVDGAWRLALYTQTVLPG